MSKNPNYLQGLAFYKQAEYEKAIEQFTLAIVKEENPNIYSERGIAWFHLGEKENALSDLNYALGLEPHNPYRYSSRAFLRDSMGDTQGAIEDYTKAVELDPDDAIALNNLGMAEEKLGYKERAEARWKQADNLAAQNDLLGKLGIALGQPPPPPPKSETAAEAEAIEEMPAPGFKDYLRVMAGVFTSSKRRSEFWKFLRGHREE